ncbi:MAG: ABC transporter ATP-binding protein, partial [Bacteroidota bacterium]
MNFWKRILQSSAKGQRYGGDLSFKENLEALKYLPPFIKMIWETDRAMATGNMALRIFQAGIPVSTLYVGKLIIDQVVLLMENSELSREELWWWVGVELALALISAMFNRSISLLDTLLGDKFSNETSVRLIEHAARLDLPQFEDSTFYDKLERARRQTSGRTMLLSQLLEQVQQTVSIAFLAAGLIVFSPWLILLLILAVIPAFVSETHFNQRSYSLARGWTPERRELDYMRYVGASDDTAKEVKIFGLDGFLRDRFAALANRYYEENASLAKKRAWWGFIFNSLGDLGYYGAYVVIILQAISGQITLGTLTFLSGSFSRLRGSLRGVLSRFSRIAQSALYLQDLFDFFAIQPAIASPKQPKPFPQPIKEGFRFQGVSFKYPSTNRYAVQNLNFTLKVGEKLALVGENG